VGYISRFFGLGREAPGRGSRPPGMGNWLFLEYFPVMQAA